MDDREHLQAQIDRLTAAVDELKSKVSAEPAALRATTAGKASDVTKQAPSRRHMLRTLGVVGVGALAGSTLVEGKAAATDGANVVAGELVTAERTTEIDFDGITDPGIVFLANASQDVPTDTSFSAMVGGWTSHDVITTGVYGLSGSDDGNGVVGFAGGTVGFGVWGIGGGETSVGLVGDFIEGALPLLLIPSETPGAPTVAAFAGSMYVDSNGRLYHCVVTGEPGTWAQVGFNPIGPIRVYDSRLGAGTPIPAKGVRNVTVAGTAGVPTVASAVAFTVTAVSPSASSYFTVYPRNATRPVVSQLNFPAHDNRNAFCVVAPGTSGQISIYNNAGSADVLIDVAGYWA